MFTVDQILAYYEVTLSLARLEAPFLPAFESFDRVNENTKTLLGVLEVLVHRWELSDGAVFIGVAVQRVGVKVVECSHDARHEGRWANRVADLEMLEPLSKIIGTRSRAVREHMGIGPSRSAEAIRRKYLPLVEEMERALAERRPPRPWDFNANHY